MIKGILSLKIILFLPFTAMSLNAQNVEVIVTGIRAEKGDIVIGVFKDSESYLTEETFMTKSFVKNVSPDGEMKVQFSLEAGIYGFCLLDDEDCNGIMEYNFLGMPKEGFGFSDYFHKGFTKPRFDIFKLTITKDQLRSVKIRVRYIL